MANLAVRSFTDSRPFDVRPSNSSREPTAPLPTVSFDRDAPYYDMSGDKFLIILNQHTFDKPKWFSFKDRASMRHGTYNDEKRLREVFDKLGFFTFVLRDMKYKKIIEYLTAIASLDHTRTSCICVTILTHGDKGGKILAADRSYQLSEVMDIFGKQKTLINKPKLFFVQACRGGNMDSGHIIKYTRDSELGTQCDSRLLKVPSYSFSMSIYEQSVLPFRNNASYTEIMNRMALSRGTDAPSLTCGSIMNFLKVCLGFWKHSSDTDSSGDPNKSILTVPTHADTLVVSSTVEDYLSYRDDSGSWMIQALCDTIEENFRTQNLLDMVLNMNRKVAYDYITTLCLLEEMNNKKQMPETRITLTKHLKFEAAINQ
ncbi:hypothetical protein PYW07_000803 [Mythimna separata]|uniref:Caspase-3 n=1 Tax=Mythimna separata TaxID=271217 RepID=A0AAD7YTA9_MYTSE|nr:hypothetical protein PYW07_000803 [Mythimna separata]